MYPAPTRAVFSAHASTGAPGGFQASIHQLVFCTALVWSKFESVFCITSAVLASVLHEVGPDCIFLYHSFCSLVSVVLEAGRGLYFYAALLVLVCFLYGAGRDVYFSAV